MLVILPVTEGAVGSSVCVVGLADTVKLGREWYVEAVMLFVLLLMLVVDEIAGLRLLCSPLPRSKKQYLRTMKNLV